MDYYLNSHAKCFGADLGFTQAEYPLYVNNRTEPLAPFGQFAYKNFTEFNTVRVASGYLIEYVDSVPMFSGYTYFSGNFGSFPSQHMYMEGLRFNKYYSRYNAKQFGQISFELLDSRSGYIYSNGIVFGGTDTNDFAENYPGEPFYTFNLTEPLDKRQSFKLNPSGDWIYDYDNCYNEYSWDITKHIFGKGELSQVGWEVISRNINTGALSTLPLSVNSVLIHPDRVDIHHDFTDFSEPIEISGVRFNYKDYIIHRDFFPDLEFFFTGNCPFLGVNLEVSGLRGGPLNLFQTPTGVVTLSIKRV